MACGEFTSVPTAVFELDTAAPTVAMPPRSSSCCEKTSADVSDAVHTRTTLSADNVVVEMLPEKKYKPDGVSPTLPLPFVYPAADAVTCTVPLLARLCR